MLSEHPHRHSPAFPSSTFGIDSQPILNKKERYTHATFSLATLTRMSRGLLLQWHRTVSTTANGWLKAQPKIARCGIKANMCLRKTKIEPHLRALYFLLRLLLWLRTRQSVHQDLLRSPNPSRLPKPAVCHVCEPWGLSNCVSVPSAW